MGNGVPESETFDKFFESWLVEQNQFLHELIDARKHNANNTSSTGSSSSSNNQELGPLIDKVLQHYDKYHRTKSSWVKKDVLGMLSPSWRTRLEEAFLWIGGWRPSMAFHLVYSKSGLQLEARLSELISGLSTSDLGDLSTNQLILVDELQRITLREEKEITRKMAKLQETVADSSMVELSHLETELIRSGGRQEEEAEQVELTLVSKEKALEEMLEKADDVRLRTLKEIIGMLKPLQAVHFLIAVRSCT
ncbi:hypothetical protein ACOSQ3_024118 [Xanthoceras sorbifolium]